MLSGRRQNAGMDRRLLLSAAALVGLSAAARANASSEAGADKESAPTVDITGMALPVLVDGRIRNYVFVALKLHLVPGKAAEEVHAKEAYYRDAIVRTAHRTSLAVDGDWNRLSEAGLSGAMMAIAGVVSGAGVVARCEVVSQAPRRPVYAPRPVESAA